MDDIDTAFRLTKVSVLDINSHDQLLVVRHNTGSGALTKYIETYVLRKGKFLGRFDLQDKPTHDANWSCASEFTGQVKEAELIAIRKARMLMLGVVEKVW